MELLYVFLLTLLAQIISGLVLDQLRPYLSRSPVGAQKKDSQKPENPVQKPQPDKNHSNES